HERTLASAERDAQAARLRAQHWTYQQIADELGYPNRSEAYRAVQRALKAAIREPGEELLALELERLDRLARAAEEVLEAHHVKVAGGGVVYGEAGQPLEDTKPVLEAIDRLLKIQERRARLLGLDARVKQQITGKVATYRVEGVDLGALRRAGAHLSAAWDCGAGDGGPRG